MGKIKKDIIRFVSAYEIVVKQKYSSMNLIYFSMFSERGEQGEQGEN
jgi:hypothetical protein